MPLTQRQGVRLLLEAGLIDSADINDRGMTVTHMSRRNRNMRVEKPDGTGFLIKHAYNHSTACTVSNEARFLESDLPEIHGIVPRIVHHDPRIGLFVTELITQEDPDRGPRSWKETNE